MIFANVKSIKIPQGNVVKIENTNCVLWEYVEELKGNLLPYAIDTDGSIYNGVGYKDGYRINSSGIEKAQSATTLTGFMECQGITDNDIIRTKGVTFNTSSYYTAILFYDEDFNILSGIRQTSATGSAGLQCDNVTTTLSVAGSSIIDGSDGITTIKINFREGGAGYQAIKYFRIFAVGKGTDLVVTINEEIS